VAELLSANVALTAATVASSLKVQLLKLLQLKAEAKWLLLQPTLKKKLQHLKLKLQRPKLQRLQLLRLKSRLKLAKLKLKPVLLLHQLLHQPNSFEAKLL